MPDLCRPNRYCWIIFDFSEHINSAPVNLASRLAAEDPVIVVKRPISILHRHVHTPLSLQNRVFSKNAQFLFYHPLHFPEAVPAWRRWGKALNERLFCRDLARLLPARRLPLISLDSPAKHEWASRFPGARTFYHPLDDKTVTLTGKAIPGNLAAERDLLSKVELAICVSETLASRIRARSPSPDRPVIHVLANAYDENLFRAGCARPEPQGLKGIPRPRILVMGHISDRLDWEGIRTAIAARPQWHWVFKGSTDPGMPTRMKDLDGDRVSFHPSTSLDELPSWIAHCDAGAAPYRLNAFTLASNPVKVIEYLAMGIPVLSTRTPSLQRFQEVVEWVEPGDGPSYVQALDRIRETSEDPSRTLRRQESVAGDSFAVRIEQFKKVVFSALPGAEKKGLSPPERRPGIPPLKKPACLPGGRTGGVRGEFPT